MTHMEENLGRYGAKRQTWSGDSPRAAYLRIKNEHPSASVEERAQYLLDKIRDDDDLLLPIMVNYTILQDRNSGHQKANPRQRAKRRAEAEEVFEEMVQRAKRASLLSMTILVGKKEKKLGDCKREEIECHSHWLTRVALKMKSGQKVSEVFTDAQLWKLRTGK